MGYNVYSTYSICILLTEGRRARELWDIMYTLHIVDVSYWLKGGEQGDVVAAVLSNSPEYTILFRWVIHHFQIINYELTAVLLAPDWLWPQSTTPSQDLRLQNRWLVQWWDQWGQPVSVKKCPTSCFVQIEAANSKWVITDSSSKLKIFNALSGICSPAYISVDGGRYLSNIVHWTKILLRRKT